MREWEKRAEIYESTIMGLRVQLNYYEQRGPLVSPQRTTPRSNIGQYLSSASRIQEQTVAVSADRHAARNYQSENAGEAF